MRLHAMLSAAGLTAVLAACGDSARSPLPTQPSDARPSFAVITVTCDPAIVRGLITQLYEPNGGGNVKGGLLNKFDQGLKFMPDKKKQALKFFFDVIEKVDGDFRAGKLPVLTNPSTAARRNELFARLLVCAGFTVPNLDPSGDIILGFINDPSKGYTFISTGGDYAVQTPPGMFSEPVLIAGAKQSDAFTVQGLYTEFPIKAEITVTPPGSEVAGKKAIVKVCQYESDFDHETDRSFMRIVQRHDATGSEGSFSVVKILQFTTAGPFLICPESAPSSFISDGGFLSRSLAAAARGLRGAGTMIVSAVAPRPLYAATAVVDGGVGGFVDSFFSFYAGVQIPDLRVQSIAPIPNPPSTLHTIGFQVVVENIGLGASPPSTFYLKVVNNSAPGVTVLDRHVDIGTIGGATEGEGAGPATTSVTVSFANSLPAGTYTVTVVADEPNAIGELNETATVPFLNNTKTQTITVAAGGVGRVGNGSGASGVVRN